MVLTGLLGAFAGAGAATFIATPSAQDDTPECIHYWGEARYRYPGYDHVVHVENGCESRAHCAVWTDVDPDPVAITVETQASLEVITRRGSPSREFTPYVECALEADSPQ
jgi:hypothetical protein